MLKVGVPRFTRVPQLLVYNRKKIPDKSPGFFYMKIINKYRQ